MQKNRVRKIMEDTVQSAKKLGTKKKNLKVTKLQPSLNFIPYTSYDYINEDWNILKKPTGGKVKKTVRPSRKQTQNPLFTLWRASQMSETELNKTLNHAKNTNSRENIIKKEVRFSNQIVIIDNKVNRFEKLKDENLSYSNKPRDVPLKIDSRFPHSYRKGSGRSNYNSYGILKSDKFHCRPKPKSVYQNDVVDSCSEGIESYSNYDTRFYY